MAVLIAIAVVAVVGWLLLIRSSGDPGTSSPGGGPVAATEQQLVTMSDELHQPLYWAGTMPNTKLELTQTDQSLPYVRYLTDGASIGDPSGRFLTIGTYPAVNGFNDLRDYAQRSRARATPLQGGGLAVTVPGSPTSVYFAYPDENVQVEVYDPTPKRALTLVKTGVIQPVTEQQPTPVSEPPPGS